MTPINTDDASQALGLPIITDSRMPARRIAVVQPGMPPVVEAVFDIELGPEDIEEIE